MAPFEIVETTADVGIRVVATSIEEFFNDAAKGMFAVMFDTEIEGWPASHEIALESPDIESLLVDWLSELFYLFERKKFIFRSAGFLELDKNALRCKALGTNYSGSIIGTEIKAVTHHLLDIGMSEDRYETTIIFDL